MKAADVTTFVLHSPEILRSFIPDDCKWPEWKCWKLTVEIWRCIHAVRLHEDPAAAAKSTTLYLDGLIMKHNGLFMTITNYTALQKPKVMHYLTHLPKNGRQFGPWIRWTNLRFEGFHQVFKRIATSQTTNFHNLPLTLANGWSQISAYEFWTGQHDAHGTTCVLDNLYSESILRADVGRTSGLISHLLRIAMPRNDWNEVTVVWCKRLRHIGRILEPGSWVLCKSTNCASTKHCLAHVVAIFLVHGVYYVALNTFPGALNEGGVNGPHWASNEQLTLCVQSRMWPLVKVGLTLVNRVPSPRSEKGDRVFHFLDV